MEITHNISNIVSWLYNLIVEISNKLTTERIALISIAVSFVIYVFNRRSEIKLRKYEAKKEKYSSFIELLVKFFSDVKSFDNNKGTKQQKTNEIILKDFEKSFYEAGINISIYGSKKLYNEYIFFRRLSTDEAVRNCKYFDKNQVLYSLARMLKIVRKEAGLNRDSMSTPKILAFAINDILKPDSMKDYYLSVYNRAMIKYLILGTNIKGTNIVWRIFYTLVKPTLSILFGTLGLLLLNLIYRPIMYLINKSKN